MGTEDGRLYQCLVWPGVCTGAKLEPYETSVMMSGPVPWQAAECYVAKYVNESPQARTRPSVGQLVAGRARRNKVFAAGV